MFCQGMLLWEIRSGAERISLGGSALKGRKNSGGDWLRVDELADGEEAGVLHRDVGRGAVIEGCDQVADHLAMVHV